ncbi:hypothetical protein ABRP58_03345 [Pectobacterium aroidearum]|uniref:hypothetical protein n=1 Tax=Pectobacterium TaxID=122277 RepID=UPI001660AFD6|nr:MULTISPECIES: hypothetical protein [Pectobacterium]MBD0845714.1 hypothetical protein [Pectobacterium carotovorum subsp. carotovorum]MBK4826969.1 hypothetical protein [Pectobacterium carotovorum subsp. carotovorum]QUI37246.1 hypothetical protein IMY97_07970 [Pectobacterium versatile]
MTRDDLEFDAYYSYFLERMNYRLLTRIDKLITMLLIVLGFSVFAPYSNIFFFGVSVAILSVLQLVYHFGQEAGLSKEQMRQYKRLLIEMSDLSNEELRSRYTKIQDADSNPWQSLEEAAFIRASIVTGRKSGTELSFCHRVIAWIAGDLPTEKESKMAKPPVDGHIPPRPRPPAPPKAQN